MNFALFLMLFVAGDDLPVTVTTKDGKSIRGTLTVSSVTLAASFGEVRFDLSKVDAIQFGDPDQVSTSDETKLKGKLQLDELTVRIAAGDVSLKRAAIAAIHADRGPREFTPGKIVDGKARNGMTYHVRLAESYSAEKGAPAIIILHGSNMNSKAYVNTIAGVWPKLAADYVLIGINGELRVKNSPEENPAFNYSGVNFVGKSKFKGYPGTDRESPALVPEVLAELRERLKIGKVYLGGHSQGGFVTYSVVMNFPELFAGAFPISAGPWIQCEPSAFDDADVRAQQRRVALAIVHGETDPAVPFTQGRSAFESFDDDGFPALRFFTDKTAGHMFARLPVMAAVEWLERMSSGDAAALARFAEQQIEAGEFRDATAAVARGRAIGAGGKLATKLRSLDEEIDRAAGPEAKRLVPLIAGAKDDSWVRDFYKFRTQFQFAAAARPVMEAYGKLRTEHEGPATKLWNESRVEFQARRQDAGYAKYQEIVQKYFASSWYRYAKPALETRPATGGK